MSRICITSSEIPGIGEGPTLSSTGFSLPDTTSAWWNNLTDRVFFPQEYKGFLQLCMHASLQVVADRCGWAEKLCQTLCVTWNYLKTVKRLRFQIYLDRCGRGQMHINLCCVCNGSSQYAGFVTVDKTSVVQLHYTPRRSAAAFEIVRQNSDPKNEESFYCVSKY